MSGTRLDALTGGNVVLQEMVSLFMDSRKRGTTGARRKCSKKTLDIYESNLKTFMNFLQTEVKDGGLTKYESIRRLHVTQFLDWLDTKEQSGEWAKATVLQILRTLRTFFRWVDLDEDCQLYELKGLQRYLPAIPKNPRRLDIPQNKELRSFKNSFDTDSKWGYRDYVATCLMIDTGIRLGEVCNLRVDHVLLEEKCMIVNGKTGPRPVAITGDMVRLLKGWMKRRTLCSQAKDSPYVFVSKYKPKMDVDAFGKSFRKHRSKYGLSRITAHTFRHSFCTNYLRKGGDIEKLRLMTGHTTYEMLKEYLHLAKIGGNAVQEELEKVSLLKEV
jgi:site-specific recombinase XerD